MLAPILRASRQRGWPHRPISPCARDVVARAVPSDRNTQAPRNWALRATGLALARGTMERGSLRDLTSKRLAVGLGRRPWRLPSLPRSYGASDCREEKLALALDKSRGISIEGALSV